MSEIKVASDVERLKIGLSWDPNEQKAGVLEESITPHNLDLSCVVLGGGQDVLDVLSPQDPKRDRYQHQIFHLGDNLSGGADFEDEAIVVNLKALDSQIESLAFVIVAQGAVKFSDIQNGSCDVLNGISLESLTSIDFQGLEKPAVIAFVLKREAEGFSIAACKEPIAALDVDLVQEALAA